MAYVNSNGCAVNGRVLWGACHTSRLSEYRLSLFALQHIMFDYHPFGTSCFIGPVRRSPHGFLSFRKMKTKHLKDSRFPYDIDIGNGQLRSCPKPWRTTPPSTLSQGT